jgi:hypothetical protein
MHQSGTSHHGRDFTFFTNGLHYGDGLVVREVGRIDVCGPEVSREVHEAEEEKRDEMLMHRLRDAEIVVTGVAVRTAPYEPTDTKPGPISEHNPLWWECVIRVRNVEKGKIETTGRGRQPAEIVTLFASSMDILWYQSPKFSEDTEGTWLLHRTDYRGNPVPALVSDHPLDFQPLSEHPRIRALLDRLQP